MNAELGGFTFKVERKAGGWAVVLNDGKVLGIGFANRTAAEKWLRSELEVAREALEEMPK